MDHNGFDRKTRHFPAAVKLTGQTQLDVLRDVIVQIFSLSYDLYRGTKIS